jgi:hypothetical protein
MALDHLGRETATRSPSAATVTGFAVQQGALDKDAPGVQEALDAEKRRAKAGTEHAERVSARLAPENAGNVPPEEGGGSA